MFMRSVAGVYYRGITHFGEMLGCAGHRMTYDNVIGRHRLEVSCRVEQSLTFRDARGGDADVHGVSRQTLGRDLKRYSCARRRLKEKVDHSATEEGRYFLDLTPSGVAQLL